MRCPFLREAQVKFCRASAFRKMIVRLPGQPENERCSSAEYVKCPAAKQAREDHPSLSHCPFLHESLVQYCSAASVTKYVPYSESILSQCGTESHNYCELFLTLAHPSTAPLRDDGAALPEQLGEMSLDGIRVPEQLYYSSNHMWLDISVDGTLHVGVDDFMAKVLGEIDQLTFLTTKGEERPTVVLTVRGVDVQMMFPNRMIITKSNSHLRTNPAKILTDPYTVGWLFEGAVSKSQAPKDASDIRAGLISGKAAQNWMKIEVGRLDKMIHNIVERPGAHGIVAMADGGGYQVGLAQHLERPDLLRLFNVFFTSFAPWRNRQ
jgi:glycine cleavage system H protein